MGEKSRGNWNLGECNPPPAIDLREVIVYTSSPWNGMRIVHPATGTAVEGKTDETCRTMFRLRERLMAELVERVRETQQIS